MARGKSAVKIAASPAKGGGKAKDDGGKSAAHDCILRKKLKKLASLAKKRLPSREKI